MSAGTCGYGDRAAIAQRLAEREAIEAALKRAEAERDALRAFVAALRDDGLDIDDPTTAPVWTGKIHDTDGRLVFDLATVETSPPQDPPAPR